VGGGWLLDHLGVTATSAGMAATGVMTAGLLWWSAARSISARKGANREQRIRAEFEASQQALKDVLAAVQEGVLRVRWTTQQVENGEARTVFPPLTARRRTGDTGLDAVNAVKQALEESCHSVIAAATHQHRMLNDQAELAEIFKSLAPRLQSLVNRSIAVISEIELNIEDPELLAAVFRVDHLLTQLRRDAESLAVLGGTTPSRDSAPVMVITAVRRAVAEIPEYARVRVGPTHLSAALPGYVSPNLVHLLAALMENATDFSSDRVEVFVHQAGAGIAIEVLDRGTGMSQEKREALNRLLAAPETEDPRARLREGKIGLLVAALLAKRHRITIELGPNIVGGTRAVAVIPPELLVSPDVQPDDMVQRTQPPSPAGPPRPIPASSPPAPAQLPGRTPRHPGVDTGPAATVQDGRPALPRRGQAEKRLPPPAQHVPPGPATSSLMANFRAGRTREDEPGPPPSA
jgi:signal transduction histidine kinase